MQLKQAGATASWLSFFNEVNHPGPGKTFHAGLNGPATTPDANVGGDFISVGAAMSISFAATN